MHILSHIAKFFPPPRYMTLPSVGVDISDSSVKYVECIPYRNTLKLGAWGDCAVPASVLSHGVVTNPALLAEVLRDVHLKSNTDFVRLSLPEERAYLFETTMKRDQTHSEICSSLEFRLEENVPLSPRDAVFDYEVAHAESTMDDVRLLVTVYDKATVESYYDVCRRASVVPLSFEVEAQAVARAVIRTGDEGTYLIVDFGKIRTGIGIYGQGSLLLTTTVDIGGQDLDHAILSVHKDADAEEMIRLKNECGILDTDEPEVARALRIPITALKEELFSRIGYWNERAVEHNLQPLEKIILTGGIANLAGLPEFLTEELGIPAVRAEVWQNAFSIEKTVPTMTKRYSYGYATAIGLALGAYIK